MRYIAIISLIYSSFSFAEINRVEFDHSQDLNGVAFTDAEAGEYIEVTITNTCDEFQENVQGLKKVDPPQAVAAGIYACKTSLFAQLELCKSNVKKTFRIPHDGTYDGYQISYEAWGKELTPVTQSQIDIICKGAATADIAKTNYDALKDLPSPLKRTTFTVMLNESPWSVEFSGGIAVSDLTDRHYYIGSTVIDDVNHSVVARDKKAEDSQDLMFAAFAHVRNKNCRFWNACRNFAISAGLGTESGQELDYFLGGSYKMGPAYLTLGYHWGQVNRLKTGVAVGTIVDGTNVTNDVVAETNLVKHTEGAAFLALTYTFGGDSKASFIKNIAPAPSVGQ